MKFINWTGTTYNDFKAENVTSVANIVRLGELYSVSSTLKKV